MNIVGIVTARGGSKRFPGKNVALLAGLPLVSYAFEAANQCSAISETWVTTDCPKVIEVAEDFQVKVIRRPAELAGDKSTSYDTVVHALEEIRDSGREFDHFVLLQPTSPLRTANHLNEAIALVEERDAKSVISVCPAEHSPYKSFKRKGEYLQPLFSSETLNLPAQHLPEVLRQNGAIYVIPIKEFLDGPGDFFIEPVAPYLMDTRSSLDIDTELDLRIAESILAQGKR